jgi:hypothetical protein
MPTDPSVRVPITLLQTRPEMCNCQCPMSGSISMYYNSNQQSCTIGTIRKRRDNHSDDDDCDSPID